MRLDLAADRWWCFACSPTSPDGTPMSGDVVDWVTQTEQVEWKAAIEILDSGRLLTNAWAGAPGAARRASGAAPGPTWTSEPPDLARTPSYLVQAALEMAWMFYTANDRHQWGSDYLARRGVHDVGLLERHTDRFEVGHTPEQPTGLVDWMRRRGLADDELVDAGLAHRRPGGRHLTDFYRDRVLIPVRDQEDKLAGFIGRNLGDVRWPKYKNPPHTVRYDKSVDLYQPLSAPEKPQGQVVVVEGVIDAMAIAVAAIRVGRSDWFCPITQSGRELSPTQLRYVLSLHDKPPIIAMDGDEPGRSSNARIQAAAAPLGHQVLVARLPDGEDPASWLAQKGPSGLRALERDSLLSPSSAHTVPGDRADELVDPITRIRLIQTVAAQYHAGRARAVGQGPGPESLGLRPQ
jgi:DNA primase